MKDEKKAMPEAPRRIRLVPSSSDYETWAKTTAKALNWDESKPLPTKPNAWLLSLKNKVS